MQGYFKRVFDYSFTAVHEAMPKCMPRTLAVGNLMGVKALTDGVQLPYGTCQSSYRGFESRRMLSAYRQWFGTMPETAKKDCCGKHNIQQKSNCSTEDVAKPIIGSDVLSALSDSGYRKSIIWTKRILSVHMRGCSSLWPQVTYE